ncbi:hypothetical protein DM826_11280 [Halonotius aquaticus]|uniref:Uncharacterized protein n=1 Tax=Halonotius aquaticus TaxID=2216978 RepID=A0A3A6PP59_9EURY|nr:hypothetical protein [Halonotius aquaticus]RJX42222.1 hypothetical protein DM826_11280 [Halonotius aquaticus]
MERVERAVRIVAVQAALLTAALHLLWAIPRLSPAMLAESVTDSRPFLFVPAAVLLITVAVAVFRGYRYRRLSSLGGGTLAALLIGYPMYHGGDAADALATEPLAVVAVAVEAIGVVAFAGLYYVHHPDRLGLAAADAADTNGDSEGDDAVDTDAGNDN